jgi:hypothetical protein
MHNSMARQPQEGLIAEKNNAQDIQAKNDQGK